MSRPPLRRLALTLALALLPTAAGAGNHVRVVLDTSKSMSKRMTDGTGPNDPGRLAVLASMLLYDLVDPNPQAPDPDSFSVLPFKRDWPRWTNPAEPPPSGTAPAITATAQSLAARDAFWRKLHAVQYDGELTYFTPALGAALASFGPETTDPQDRRILVLVTDGLPQPEIRAKEVELLQELREELLRRGIALYVLAFGPTAERERAFFDALFAGPQGQRLGELLIDPTGADLVLNMARIFSRSFGYDVDPLGTGPRVRTLDLDGRVTPPRVGVVALRRGGGPPAQDFDPTVNAPRGLFKAAETGAAYSAQIIEGVRPGTHYRFTTDSDSADVAILRQVRPELHLLPGFIELPNGDRADLTQVRRVVADTPFVLKAQAQSPIGTAGDQAELEIAFRTLGPRKSGCEHAWSERLTGAAQGSRDPAAGGATYDIRMQFPANRTDPGAVYQGFIEVAARFHGQKVGELSCETGNAQPVEVYPRIAILADPPDDYLSPQTLRRGQRGCAGFRLRMDDPAKLAALRADRYRLSAYVAASDPGARAGALAAAAFTFDGEPVGYREDSAAWRAGRELTREELLGGHELCVTLGVPRIAAPSDELRLTLHLQLAHTPYDDFRVVDPFTAKLRVLPVLDLESGRVPEDALAALALPLLAGLAALLLLVPRLPLPPDLGYRVAAEPVGAEGADADPLAAAPWQALPVPTAAQRLLGRSPPRRLLTRDGATVLGLIRPLARTLYGFTPSRGIVLREPDGTAVTPVAGSLPLHVHRDYRLDGEAGAWRLRLCYQRPPSTDPGPATPPGSRRSSPPS